MVGSVWNLGSGGYYGMTGGYYGGTGMMGAAYAPWGMYGWGAYAWVWVPIIVASIAVAAFGVFMMSSARIGDVRIGAVLVLVGAVLAFPTAFGFVVGSLLMVLGGILGLIWSPTQQTRL